MTLLPELILKWQDGSLTEAELVELNSRLRDPEARAVLAREFALSAALVEAAQLEEARTAARRQAQAFETQALREEETAEVVPAPAGFRRGLAVRSWPTRWRKRAWAFTLAAGVVALAVWGGLSLRGSAVARLELAPAGLTIVRDGRTLTAAEAGLRLKLGDQVNVPATETASFVYAREKTRLQLHGATQVTIGLGEDGKRLELARGGLTADVAPQPDGQAMVVVTPHAVATVLGTELSLIVSPDASRLEVMSGMVRLSRRPDEKSIMVSAGDYALAGLGVELAAHPLLQAPWQSQDIGLPARPGSAKFESDGKKCHVHAHASENRRGRDDFHFVYQTLDGDGEIRARVLQFDPKDKRTKAGVVIRGSLRSDALTAFLRVNAGRGLEFKRRGGEETRVDLVGRESFPYWVRLVRQGSTITAYKSPDGVNWTPTGAGQFHLDRRIYIGLGVAAADKSAGAAVFDNVSVLPAPDTREL